MTALNIIGVVVLVGSVPGGDSVCPASARKV